MSKNTPTQNTLEKQKSASGVGESLVALWEGFVESIYISNVWGWFMNLMTRLVQPILFVTVMYSIAETYPGFPADPIKGVNLSLFMFVAQNAALDLGSFGLPGLIKAALDKGVLNQASADKANKLAKALFIVMMTNLTWGAIERIFTGLDGNLKLVVSLIFIVVRSYYALEYSKVIHVLQPHDASKKEPRRSLVQQLRDELLEEIQGFKTEIQGFIEGSRGEIQGFTITVQGVQGQVDELRIELQGFKTEIQGFIEGSRSEVHILSRELQGVQGLLGGKVDQALLERVEPLLRSLEDRHLTAIDQIGGRIDVLRDDLSSKVAEVHGTIAGVQGELSVKFSEVEEIHEKFDTRITEVQEVQAALPMMIPERTATSHTEPLPVVGEPRTEPLQVQEVQGEPLDARERVFRFIQGFMADQDREPTLPEIERGSPCSRNTAIKYRREFQAVQVVQ